jgi:hypothetical protein
MLGDLAALNFLYYARAAQSGAGVSRLVFHASIVFPCPEDRFGFAKSNTHPCAGSHQTAFMAPTGAFGRLGFKGGTVAIGDAAMKRDVAVRPDQQ